jgi:hypothetical protein
MPKSDKKKAQNLNLISAKDKNLVSIKKCQIN